MTLEITTNRRNRTMYGRVWARVPDALYQDFCNYINKTGQKKTQAIVYAIAKYIGSNQKDMNEKLLLDAKIDDLTIDVQDIEGYLEQIEKRLSRIEHQLTDDFTDHDKFLIKKFTEDCLTASQMFTVKDILILLNRDCNDNSLQRQVGRYLKSQGWYKVRRTVDGQKQYVWVR